MAAPSIDIAQLSDDQQLALQQFTAVTDQDVDQAIPLLQRCQWNVQIAIARFFDGEPAEPAVPAEPVAAPQDPRRRETLANGFGSSSRSSSAGRRNLEPAPRVVPQPENQVTQQAPFLLSVIIFPFRFAYNIVSRVFNLFSYLFPFLPRLFASRAASQGRRRDTSGRRTLNPRDTAARFIREFEEEYGSHELPLFEGGYAQAFDLAKKELKFLLVVLISPEHDDTTSHIRDTLLAPEVVNFLKDPQNNIIVWAGNVQDAEAYQVSNALNCTKLPFAGLIVHTPSDRERARQKREAEEARQRAEQEEREKQEAKERAARNLEQWRKWRAQSVAAEPSSDAKDIVRISLRMPSGDRVVRRFTPDTQIEELYAFVECYDFLQDGAEGPAVEKPASYEHEYEFVLVSPMPREEFGLEKGGTVRERIGRSGNLIVERTAEDDEEEEDE
ncbi:putative ubx domain protein [Neofusicoccum parvum UCRNP2]|uniref:Putative ubx domain protein n=1 Tax=Botryosphaeria parva (strain UCR-NP2) TaxID=1287680 RepID=R1GZZ5_BOTPV|nr:putative ubx domain protein [Neofusicoccum parvum UCRNP2]